ncbi:sterol desaturase family protein [Gracilimonas sp.]|uniref:sterol desaturase family protein n=1 Tax=Gracilimonas sp. TaxID=1974203 RepID=UPI0028718692|nr:sterol desaturase family protein [Gracilimonas sp.]
MEALVDFFENVPTTFRAGILIGGIFLFWVIEGVFPLFEFGYKKVRHAAINLVLNAFFVVIGLGFAGILVWSSNYVTTNEFGVLQWIEMPIWAQAIVGVMLLDFFGAYLIHWIEHKVKFMWRFHLVHHSDTTVDVTTGLRHHPGEAVFRMVFTIIGVIVVGVPIWIVFLYQSISALFAHLTHANINMPKKLDRALSWIFITPLMHKVHHHYTQPLTDTNYGNIFAIWDRVFGTFAEVEDVKELKYGIDTHMDPEENSDLGNLLKIPFQIYRPPVGSKFGEEKEIEIVKGKKKA